ncbi:MAG: RecX family transcriptional regulator [Propionibacteriaceae bacterium]|nr:RecX family transcriptional regulator [Propionibacteriaceae bacterium]
MSTQAAGARGGEVATPSPRDPVDVVREMALRCLDRRAYGTTELKAVLLRKGADAEVVDDVLARLTRVGLLDDAAYAQALVETRHGVRLQSRQAVVLDMRRRGLSGDVVDAATATLDDEADLAGARQVVAQKLRRLADLDSRTISRRLAGALARKGYSPAVVSTVVGEVIRDLRDVVDSSALDA